MIQDGSIGRGVRLTTRLAVSMSVRDIKNPGTAALKNRLKMQKRQQLGKARRQATNKLLSLPYGDGFNRSKPSRVKRHLVRISRYLLLVSRHWRRFDQRLEKGDHDAAAAAGLALL